MLQKKIIAGWMLICACIFLPVSCYKDKTVIVAAPEIKRTVSFSKDIITIFNNSCNTSGCHNAGGQSPNLSATAAFNSLINGNFIDKATPENSLLYKKLTGKQGTPMPPSGINQDYVALVLAWIKQGANNN